MIVDLIVTAVVALLRAVLSLVPTWSVSLPSFTAAGDQVGSYASLFSQYFPVAVLGSCLVAVLATKVGLSVWTVVTWLYDRFPLKFT